MAAASFVEVKKSIQFIKMEIATATIQQHTATKKPRFTQQHQKKLQPELNLLFPPIRRNGKQIVH